MSDPELDEIDKWLAGFDDDVSEWASRAYSAIRAQRMTKGELPAYLRSPWITLPKDYRAFLTYIAQCAVDHAKVR
jgi:hypothetical protein